MPSLPIRHNRLDARQGVGGTGHHPNEIESRSHWQIRRLGLALLLNVSVVAVQVAGSAAAHSLGLLADAGHGLVDIGALALALGAARLARRGPTAARSFGYHRSGVLAAQVNAVLIVAVTVVIAVIAVQRLVHPVAVTGSLVVPVALVATAGNAAAALALLGRDHRHDLNVRAALWHLLGDAGASVGVAVTGAVIWLTGRYQWLDPAVSLGIGALIGYQGLVLVKQATEVLLESTPAGLDTDQLAAAIAHVGGVESVHDLHTWSLSPEVRALSAHLVLSGHPSLEEAQQVAEQVKGAVRGPFGLTHVTLELECETCVTEGVDPCAVSALTAPTSSRDDP